MGILAPTTSNRVQGTWWIDRVTGCILNRGLDRTDARALSEFVQTVAFRTFVGIDVQLPLGLDDRPVGADPLTGPTLDTGSGEGIAHQAGLRMGGGVGG